VNGQVVRTATGDDTGVLKPVDWDVGDLQGQSAQVQVIDQATGAWGHIMVDHLLLSD
jgi:levanbiose-producing levanase